MRTTKPRRVYWDSCIFIDAIQQTPSLSDTLRQIIADARAGTAQIITSTFTLAEVIGSKDAASRNPALESTIRELFNHRYIVLRPVDKHIAEQARQIARDNGLKPADAIHVATAIESEVQVMHTRDGMSGRRGLLPCNGKIGAPPLCIEYPTWAKQLKLPGDGDD